MENANRATLKKDFESILTAFRIFFSEKCEDFFCSRCKEGLILQNKGGNNCLEKCPFGFFRKQDLLSGQAYCKSE